MKASRLLLLTLLAALGTLPLAAQVNDTYVIPAAANSNGAFNTRWLTQFSVFNPQAHTLRITVVFLPTAGKQGMTADFDVPSNAVAFSDNLIGDLFEVGDIGALLVASLPEKNPGLNDVLSRSFLVTSNTYNNSPNGTFGQTIPGVWTGLQDDGITAVAHGIRHVDRLGWRTNIGAVNLGRYSTRLYVTIYDADGRTIARDVPFTVPPMGHFQDRLPYQVENGSIEFVVDDPYNDAVVFPYTSTIDQLSGDPTYQSPVLLASPGLLYSHAGKAAALAASPGKKIDSSYVRAAVALSVDRGVARLVREEKGMKITK